MPNYAEDIDCKHYDSFTESELPKTEQSNAELIRNMPLEMLNIFLFKFKIDAVTSFVQHGGEKIMNAAEQRAWLQGNSREFMQKLFKSEEDE